MHRLAIWTVLYPIVAHIGVQLSNHYIPIVYLFVLTVLSILLSKKLDNTNKTIYLFLLALSIFLIFTLHTEELLMQLIPLVILLVLSSTFFKSLRHGSVPIITKFATYIDGKKLSLEKEIYTRAVTKFWLVIFVYMFIQSIAVYLFYSIDIWSWVTHIFNYFIIVFALLAEFVYRKFKFKNEKHNFVDFVVKLTKYRLNNKI